MAERSLSLVTEPCRRVSKPPGMLPSIFFIDRFHVVVGALWNLPQTGNHKAETGLTGDRIGKLMYACL